MIEALKNAPALSFIDDRTVDELLEEMVGDYESFMTAAAGTPQKLSRASPARMVLAAAAAQIYGALQLIDRAGKQNLLQYSYGGFLDNLALFKGVTRKPASPASVLLRFTLSAARDAATGIPQGTRVSTVDGVYFAADQYAEIPAGSLTVDVRATCTLPGAGYNGIPAGAVGAIVDPVPYVASAVSISASSGGADIEDDEALAERIYNAPSGYSTAGPEAGYLYHAKQFSAAVGDVAVSSVQAAGRVDVVFVMADGSTPDSAAIAGLTAYLKLYHQPQRQREGCRHSGDCFSGGGGVHSLAAENWPGHQPISADYDGYGGRSQTSYSDSAVLSNGGRSIYCCPFWYSGRYLWGA